MSSNKPKDLFLIKGISCLSFNKSFTECALSTKENNIYIYQTSDLEKPENWKLTDTLNHHLSYISGLDWCGETNKILSCSYDKVATVWTKESNKWTKENVNATTKVGYLTCSWNKRGDKFVLGTSGKKIFIGYYNKQNSWWIGYEFGKIHKSSVNCAKIDPSSLYVISGSTDLRCYIISAYMPKIDDQFIGSDQKGNLSEIGTVLYSFEPEAWICDVGWSLDGSYAFATTQSSIVGVIDFKNKTTEVVNLPHQPIDKIFSNGNNSFIGITYERNILLYEKQGDKWEQKKNLSDSGKTESKSSVGVLSKVKVFSQQSTVKKDEKAANISHLHHATISSYHIKGNKLITTDFAGFVKFWGI